MQELVIQSDMVNMAAVEQFVSVICDECNINNYAATISVPVLHAVENAIVHGNHNDVSKKVTVLFDQYRGGVSFSIQDEGCGFDFGRYGSMPDQEESGTGVYLMKTLSDQLTFLDGGSKVKMDFLINGIDASRALERKMTLRKYYAHKVVHA